MKTTNTILLIGALALISIVLISFQMVPTTKSYQHIMIFAEHYDFDNVLVSIDGKEYKKLKLTKQIQGPWDFNPMINLIHQYENEGYELSECGTNFWHLKKVIE
jgi:hypothetical protein